MRLFHLPNRRQYRCLSSCGVLLGLAILIPILLLFAGLAALPSFSSYLEQFDTQPIVDLALNEIRSFDGVSLQLSDIQTQADGAVVVIVDYWQDGLPITSVNLSFSSSVETSGSFSLLPGGYSLRLVSASEQSARFQIFLPEKEK